MTPMMIQYREVKLAYTEHIVLFRMGDFYEVFFEDAHACSRLLNITLTHRGKLGEFPIPMAGIPHHAAQSYVDRLAGQGYKVAICEQVEDPKETKGIVKRAVTQVVSPAIPYDLEKGDQDSKNFILSTLKDGEKYYLVAIDFTTGEFFGQVFCEKNQLLEKIQILLPKEIITYMGQWDDWSEYQEWVKGKKILVTNLSEEYFKSNNTDIYIEKFISTYKRDKTLLSEPAILNAIGPLCYYVLRAQMLEHFYHLKPFALVNNNGLLKISLSTLIGIEILPRDRNSYAESVLGFFDKTKTSAGKRALRDFFLAPLQDKKEIESRYDISDYFLKSPEKLEQVRDELSLVRDIERILAKVTTKRTTPGDLLALAHCVSQFEVIQKILTDFPSPDLLIISKSHLAQLKKIANTIIETINDEIGASFDKGNLVKNGINKERDRLARLGHHANSELELLEKKYREETGISKLRVKSNNVAGHFIEISKVHTESAPSYFKRKQTLTNAERYTTKELQEFEKDFALAKNKLEALEKEIFQEIVSQVASASSLWQNLASRLSSLDTFQSMAHMARQEGLVRPQLHKTKKILHIEGAWHPLIRGILNENFVSHDLKLNSDIYFGLITGPNMAGKTTVMREVAIIQLLAQIGCFVPAAKAELGICDYLFSRLGASDDILKGQSTFMVEMSETAEIVRHATSRSLIILDEVGRGTSTYDGMSIAWALVEHLEKEIQALCLFATHYHELIDLAHKLPHAQNFTVATERRGNQVDFLYRLIEGAASQSYGIYVAKLAGLPPKILQRSEKILNGLEAKDTSSFLNKKEKKNGHKCLNEMQLSFFGDEAPKIPEYLLRLEDSLLQIDIKNMTPLQALNTLDNLCDTIKH